MNMEAAGGARVATARGKEGGVTSVETYKLDCYACLHTLELPASRAMALLVCPRCGAGIEIDWRGIERERA